MMNYETLQTALTALINVTAIAGFGGIIAHAIYTRHTAWMQTYCPPIATHTPDIQEAEALAPEPEQPEAMPATDVALEALKEVEEEGQKPAARKPRSRKPAQPKAPAKPRATRKRKAA